MAEEDTQPSPERVLDQRAGVAFRAEMWLTDRLLRYWKHLAGAAVAILLGAFAWGQWSSWYESSQRRVTAEIAAVEAVLSMPIEQMPIAKAGLIPGKKFRKSEAREAADELMRIADAGRGMAAVEGWLKAAELYRTAGEADKRRDALTKAAGKAGGVLYYATVLSLANLDIEEGKADEGVARLRALAKQGGFEGRRALLDLGLTLEGLGRTEDARAAYDELITTFPEADEVSEARTRRDALAGGAG